MSELSATIARLSPQRRALLERALRREGVDLGRSVILPRRRDGGGSPLSFAQLRLWWLDRFAPGIPAYNVPTAVLVDGALGVAVLGRVLAEVVRRHEVLRTRFEEAGGEPVQVVLPARPVPLPLIDLSSLESGPRGAELSRLAAREALSPFDLGRGDLLRGTLVRLGQAQHAVLLTLHHVACDAWSMEVLLREVGLLYEAFAAGRRSPLPELPIQYADYAAWQRQWVSGEVLAEQLAYWRGTLAGITSLELPADRPRPSAQTFAGASLPVAVAEDRFLALRMLARRQEATPFMALLAVFAALLHRYTGQRDVAVGSPVANRGRAEVEGLIGFFVNTLVLRLDLGGEPSLSALLERARAVTLGAYAHQDLPFEKLVEDLEPERNLARTPLFQVMLVLQSASQRAAAPPAGGGAANAAGPAMRPLPVASASAKFDLLLSLAEVTSGLRGVLEFNTDLFDRGTAARLARHFLNLLEAAVRAPEEPLARLPLLADGERQQLVAEWNDTAAAEGGACVHHLFARQAGATPATVALVGADEHVSYGELARRARSLARLLRRLGVGVDGRVGLAVGRSPAAPPAVLAVLEAGAAYVPLDLAYPPERLRFMAADAGLAVLLAVGESAADWQAGLPARLVRLDAPWPSGEGEETPQGGAPKDGAPADGAPAGGATPESLAYVLYTSGSTGRPKGVAMPHGPLANLVAWQRRESRLPHGARTLQFASLSFDVSFQEMFATWCAGGALCLIGDDVRRDAARLWDELGRSAVARLFLPYVALAQLAEVAPRKAGSALALSEAVTAGEQLQVTRRLADLFAGLPAATLANQYGPTEAHVVSCEALAPPASAWPTLPLIGRPIRNTRLEVLDRRGRPQPTGVVGELWIGGVALARGYLGRPALTAERFCPHAGAAEPGARLYRSGDLARLRADGRVEFLGRADAQVKVRGHRVEPGEVEAVLGGHPDLAEAVVTVTRDGAGNALAAYVVPRAGGPSAAPTAGELRAFLRARLPDPMVPSYFVALPALPLTPSGKVDRRSLPPPQALAEASGTRFVAPRTPTEELVAAAIAEVLNREPVGAEDDFFELGGHSLLATQVTSRLLRVFGVELPLRRLFEAPTVAALSAAVEEVRARGASATRPALERAPRDRPLPLSFAQERLWFLDRLEPGNPAYNLPTALAVEGGLEVRALASALARRAAPSPSSATRRCGRRCCGRRRRSTRCSSTCTTSRPTAGRWASWWRRRAPPTGPRCGARNRPCRSCRSSTRTTRCGSARGSTARSWPARSTSGAGTSPGRRGCWSCRPTGRGGGCRPTAAGSGVGASRRSWSRASRRWRGARARPST